MEVNKALRRFREEFGLSQKDVADRLGILPQAYSRYETGKFYPKVNDLLKLTATYNVSADYLLGLSDNPRPPDTSTLVAAINDAHKILGDALDTRPQ